MISLDEYFDGAKIGDIKLIRRFIADHKDYIDEKDTRFGNDNNTALIHAAKNDKVEVVEALIQAGANPNILNYWHCTALSYAINLCQFKVAVVILSSKKIDINLRIPIYHSYLHIAVNNFSNNLKYYDLNNKIIELILSKGCRIAGDYILFQSILLSPDSSLLEKVYSSQKFSFDQNFVDYIPLFSSHYFRSMIYCPSVINYATNLKYLFDRLLTLINLIENLPYQSSSCAAGFMAKIFCKALYELICLNSDGQEPDCEYLEEIRGFGVDIRAVNDDELHKQSISFIKRLMMEIVNNKYFNPYHKMEYEKNDGSIATFTPLNIFNDFLANYEDLGELFKEKQAMFFCRRFTESHLIKRYSILKVIEACGSENELKSIIDREIMHTCPKQKQRLVNSTYNYIMHNYSGILEMVSRMHVSPMRRIVDFEVLKIVDKLNKKEIPKIDIMRLYIKDFADKFISDNRNIEFIHDLTNSVVLPYGCDVNNILREVTSSNPPNDEKKQSCSIL